MYVDANKLEGVLFFGDRNARHFCWGDNICNQLGNELILMLTSETTFLTTNGCRTIALCWCLDPTSAKNELTREKS